MLGSTAAGRTFGGFAESSWKWNNINCWVNPRQDFLFRLAPGKPVLYRAFSEGAVLQLRGPDTWPAWGGGPKTCHTISGRSDEQYCHWTTNDMSFGTLCLPS